MPDDKRPDEERAEQEMADFAAKDELPSDPREWPSGPARNLTFAGDSDAAYGEDELTRKLGPSLVRHEDGSVTVDGEPVENPEDYKGEPIELAVDRPTDRDRKGGGGGEKRG